MKNLFVLLIAVFYLGALASCASTPKKNKGCKGKGDWYRNRNLGDNYQQKENQNIYILAPTTEAEANL